MGKLDELIAEAQAAAKAAAKAVREARHGAAKLSTILRRRGKCGLCTRPVLGARKLDQVLDESAEGMPPAHERKDGRVLCGRCATDLRFLGYDLEVYTLPEILGEDEAPTLTYACAEACAFPGVGQHSRFCLNYSGGRGYGR